MGAHREWTKIANIADIVEADDQIKARIRLAAEWHLKAHEALLAGDLDHFLSMADLAGHSAARTRYGQYNGKMTVAVDQLEDLLEITA